MTEGLKITIKKEEKCKRVIDIEVPRDNITREMESTIDEVQKIANIPGFRQGKVPRNLVVQYYREKIESDALDKLIRDSYIEALNKEKLVPVNEARIKDVKFEHEKPLFFSAEIEIKPEIKFRFYKGIEVDEERVRVDEEDVNGVLKNIQDRMAEYTTIENRPAQKGDVVTVDFAGFKDFKPLEKFKGKDLKVEIGAKTVLPDIDEGIIGMNINAEKEIQVKLPKDFYDKELQGAEITIKIKLKAIQEKKLSVLDDEFAKDVGECESLAELKKKIEDDIRKNREEEKKSRIEQKILKELTSITPFDVPVSLVERELDYIMDDIKERMKRENSTFESLNTTEIEVKEKYMQFALEKVKAYLIIEEIAKLENIKVADEDVKEETSNIITRMNRKDQKTIEYFSSDAVKERIRYDIMVRRTFDFLYNNAKINWK